MRGDVPAKLGIRYEDLRDLNPAIVCCSLSGFGSTGPRAAQPGYDYIIQGLAGWMDVTGEPGGPPSKSGLSLVDWSGGYVAALSILAALHVARRDGRGSECDVSLFDNAISLLTYLATWNLTAGYVPTRTRHSAHPSIVPFQNFQTADGWIVVGCAKEHFWTKLVEAIGLPELADDARFASLGSRYTTARRCWPSSRSGSSSAPRRSGSRCSPSPAFPARPSTPWPRRCVTRRWRPATWWPRPSTRSSGW